MFMMRLSELEMKFMCTAVADLLVLLCSKPYLGIKNPPVLGFDPNPKP